MGFILFVCYYITSVSELGSDEYFVHMIKVSLSMEWEFFPF